MQPWQEQLLMNFQISHRLCLFHIYVNAATHLGHVIYKHPDKFLPAFKRCVYEDRSEAIFIQKWNELLSEYKLEDNKWMKNLYDLRKKWAAVYRDSFTADMNSTQRSEGMNNVFKKRMIARCLFNSSRSC
jgi:zinc finger SWIM domain-containing protein 3